MTAIIKSNPTSLSANYLSLSVFPGPINKIDWEDLHAQPPLNAVHHDMQAFAVPDYEARVVQFVGHLFEVQVGILGQTSETSLAFENNQVQNKKISAAVSVRVCINLCTDAATNSKTEYSVLSVEVSSR